MIIVIDGYNVLKQIISHQKITQQERRQFLHKLWLYYRKKKHNMVVFFDGESDIDDDSSSSDTISVIYAGHAYTADECIKEYLEKHQNRELILVSTDRELNAYADSFNIPSLDAIDFYRILTDNKPMRSSLSTQATKTSKQHNPELDYLMTSSSAHIESKQDDNILQGTAKDRKLSKKERKLLSKLKKL